MSNPTSSQQDKKSVVILKLRVTAVRLSHSEKLYSTYIIRPGGKIIPLTGKNPPPLLPSSSFPILMATFEALYHIKSARITVAHTEDIVTSPSETGDQGSTWLAFVCIIIRSGAL